ncbi:hypothetical protein EVAR_103835_1 [Eumeta japonica]|uniref:Uncharacterized protein n=1 Tax=Eumeta variegata TaxID=151549 RepID=A0A4C2ABW5_EUMVA|nr:hypothetical protein EVAR_103835_1 [Eumeta japonica]
MQIQVSGVRKVGRAGVIIQTTSTEAAERIKKATPPELRVTEPKSRRPLVALHNMMGDPTNEAVLSGIFEQNLRTKCPDWSSKNFGIHAGCIQEIAPQERYHDCCS